jgi:hypothetical protein
MHNVLRCDGIGRPIDWRYLATEATKEEQDAYLLSFGSYQRPEALRLLMHAVLSPGHCLRLFADWFDTCDAPWPWRSSFRGALRKAFDTVSLEEVLGPEALAFYNALPDQVPIWRGCERGRERGLSWTTDKALAEKFAVGVRCGNARPTVVSAEIPKQHVFSVNVEREESEVVVDYRRLRKIHIEALEARDIERITAEEQKRWQRDVELNREIMEALVPDNARSAIIQWIRSRAVESSTPQNCSDLTKEFERGDSVTRREFCLNGQAA